MFESGVASYPVERTLLVSGLLDFAMESRFQGYKRLMTEELSVRYQTDEAPDYCRGKPPWG